MTGTITLTLKVDRKALRESMERRSLSVAKQMRQCAEENILDGVDGNGVRFAAIWPRYEDGSTDNILCPTGTHLIPSMKAKATSKKAILEVRHPGARILHEGGTVHSDEPFRIWNVEENESNGFINPEERNYPSRRFGIPGRNWNRLLNAFEKG